MADGMATSHGAGASGSIDVTELAGELLDAERHGRAVPPLSERRSRLTIDDAYAVQESWVRMRADAGALPVGFKVGATSAATQQLFGVDTPDYGRLFADMRVDGDVHTSTLIQPMVEPEIAFELGSDLRGPVTDDQQVVAAIAGVRAALEIIDSRIADWRIGLVDTVADNGSSGRFVLGDVVVPILDVEPLTEAGTFSRNGDVLATPVGANALGDPLHVVAWLADALAVRGQYLPRGSIVLSGSLAASTPAVAGDQFEVRFDTLGTAACRFV